LEADVLACCTFVAMQGDRMHACVRGAMRLECMAGGRAAEGGAACTGSGAAAAHSAAEEMPSAPAACAMTAAAGITATAAAGVTAATAACHSASGASRSGAARSQDGARRDQRGSENDEFDEHGRLPMQCGRTQFYSRQDRASNAREPIFIGVGACRGLTI
jgi:hypothetical protein